MPFVDLDGVSGTYVSIPDSANVSPSPDLQLDAYVELDNWSSGSTQVIAAKYQAAGNQRSYGLQITGSGQMQFFHSTDGTSANEDFQTTGSGFLSGAMYLRVTMDGDNGAGDCLIRFYTSTDGISWTNRGGDKLVGSTRTIYDSNVALEIGGLANGSVSMATGNFYWVRLYDGDGGSQVAGFNAADAASNNATTVADEVSGTWTTQGNAAFSGIVTGREVSGSPSSDPTRDVARSPIYRRR